MIEKISPFNIFIQVGSGNVEVRINGESNILKCGHAIIIPAHSRRIINPSENFKIIVTIIKRGYVTSYIATAKFHLFLLLRHMS